MDQTAEVPPKLCCINVRLWTLVVAYVCIVFYALALIYSVALLIGRVIWNYISLTLVNIVLMVFNIKLRNAVFKRDLTTIRSWLLFYSFLFILLVFLNIFVLFLVLIMNYESKTWNKEELLLTILCNVIIEVILGLWIYPVYLYYKFLKTRSQQ